jgi:hypothetical protein
MSEKTPAAPGSQEVAEEQPFIQWAYDEDRVYRDGNGRPMDLKHATLPGGEFNGRDYDAFRVTNGSNGVMTVKGVKVDNSGKEHISSLGEGSSKTFFDTFLADAQAGLEIEKEPQEGEVVQHGGHMWLRHNNDGEEIRFSATERIPAATTPEDGNSMIISAKGGARFLFEPTNDGEGNPAWKITQHRAGGANIEHGVVSADSLPPLTIGEQWNVDLPDGSGMYLRKIKRVDIDKGRNIVDGENRQASPEIVDADPWGYFGATTPDGGTPEPEPEPTPEPGTPEPGTPEPGTPEPGTPDGDDTDRRRQEDETVFKEVQKLYEQARNEYAKVLAEESAVAFKGRKALKERKEMARGKWLAMMQDAIAMAGHHALGGRATEYKELRQKMAGGAELSDVEKSRLEEIKNIMKPDQDLAVFREAYYLEEAKRKFAGELSERGPKNKFLGWWAKRPDSNRFGKGKFANFMKKAGIIAVPAAVASSVVGGVVAAGAAGGTGMGLHSHTKRYRKLQQRSEIDAGRNIERMFKLNDKGELASDSPSLDINDYSKKVELRNEERLRNNRMRMMGSVALGAATGVAVSHLVGNLIGGGNGSEGSSLPDSGHRPFEVPDAGLNGPTTQPTVEMPGVNGGENALVPDAASGNGAEVAIEGTDVFKVEYANGIPHEVQDALAEVNVTLEPGQETAIYERIVEEFGKDNILQRVESAGAGTYEPVGTGADATYIMGPNTNYAGNVGIQHPGLHMWAEGVRERILELAQQMGHDIKK